MERCTPVRKPHTSIADLLTWTEAPSSASSNASASSAQRCSARSNQYIRQGPVWTSVSIIHLSPSGIVYYCSFRKPCSGYKMKEMTGSGIYAANSANGASKLLLLILLKKMIAHQAVNGISQISFSADGSVSPKKPTSLPEPAGGQTSILFTEEPVVKTANKINNQKFQELTGNDIFMGDVPPGSAEKPLSRAKLQEMSGNDIFSYGKVESRYYLGGVRKPPGGERAALPWFNLIFRCLCTSSVFCCTS
ncbi:hypothetical protein CRYUN_Cryun15aG0092000 [Craigia yunnanensis]